MLDDAHRLHVPGVHGRPPAVPGLQQLDVGLGDLALALQRRLLLLAQLLLALLAGALAARGLGAAILRAVLVVGVGCRVLVLVD